MSRFLVTLVASIILALAVTVYALSGDTTPPEPLAEPVASEPAITTDEPVEPLEPVKNEAQIDPQGCEPEQYWAKEFPHDCQDKPQASITPEPTASSAPVSGSTQQIKDSITKWAIQYGVSPARLLRVANCESGYNPSAVNRNYYAGGGNPSGLFQYLPETWNRISGRAGLSGYDKWNYDHQARVTAWAFANGYSGEWACK